MGFLWAHLYSASTFCCGWASLPSAVGWFRDPQILLILCSKPSNQIMSNHHMCLFVPVKPSHFIQQFSCSSNHPLFGGLLTEFTQGFEDAGGEVRHMAGGQWQTRTARPKKMVHLVGQTNAVKGDPTRNEGPVWPQKITISPGTMEIWPATKDEYLGKDQTYLDMTFVQDINI